MVVELTTSNSEVNEGVELKLWAMLCVLFLSNEFEFEVE